MLVRTGRVALVARRPSLQRCGWWHTGIWRGEPASWADAVRRACWARLQSPAVIPWLFGTRLRILPENETSACVFFDGRFEPNESRWLAGFLQPGMNVIDAGANLGLYTLLAARRVGPRGQVVSFEPSAREFAEVQANVRLSRLANVSLRYAALAERPGEGVLHVAEDGRGGHNSLGEFCDPVTRLARMETVDLETVDAAAARLGAVHVIKADVEGAEARMLAGAEAVLGQDRPALLLELTDRTLKPQGSSRAEVCQQLRARGYRLFAFHHLSGKPAVLGDPDQPGQSANVLALHPAGPGGGAP